MSMCQHKGTPNIDFFLIELEGLSPLQKFINKGGSEITRYKTYRIREAGVVELRNKKGDTEN